MKRVFIDTNVLIDYVSKRDSFFEPAAQIMQLGQRRKVEILVSGLSFATCSFILEAHYKFSNDNILRIFSELIKTCNITPVDSDVINKAIASNFSDFEDAMQYQSALRGNADCILTRNKSDFTSSKIRVFAPLEFLQMLSQ
jgi:predicted nucleic-acid-binding protein